MGCGASNAAATNSTRDPLPPPQPGVSRPISVAKDYRHGSPISQGALNNQRNEFWETRTGGNTLMWQAIRSAAEASLSNDIALANAILEASNVSTPTASLEICYDERGFQYKIPMFCFANPIELNTTGAPATGASGSGANVPVATALGSSSAQQQQSPNGGSNSSNGKSPPSPPLSKSVVDAKPLNVRVKLNPGDHNFSVEATSGYSVQQLKQCILNQSTQQPIAIPMEAVSEDRQRIIFMGKELQNAQIIGDLGFDETRVVQVFLRPAK